VTLDVVRSVRASARRTLALAAIPLERPLLVAVSGGQDSVCLLDALAVIWAGSGEGAGLIVIHVDHRLRGAASRRDAEAVAALARRYQLGYVRVEADVAAYAEQAGIGLEEAGREVRYRAFAEAAVQRQVGAVATGHTEDDSAETLLMNILRGTGLTGISGIQTRQISAATGAEALQVVRPLLGVSRTQTEAYCRALDLPFQCDASNADVSFLRNRVRHHLMPLLRTYSPSIVSNLGRLAEIAADDDSLLESVAEQSFQAVARRGPAEVAFDWADWLALAPALQRRLLRRSRHQLIGVGAWSFRSLETARLLLQRRPARRRLDLGGGIHLSTSRRDFRLQRGRTDS
jgi:tRNA(Ile)-lysidine synthase